jgi:flagellar biosynthesis/type III secretory pathway chaperone
MDATEQQLVSQSLHKANALKTVLEKEFSALKDQDLTQFEKLQTQKLDILAFLSQQDFLEQIKIYAGDQEATANQLAVWDEIISLIAQCKELHRRNEILINSKLESIRSALKTIQSPDPLSSVEVYDRLGQIRPGRSGKPLSEA